MKKTESFLQRFKCLRIINVYVNLVSYLISFSQEEMSAGEGFQILQWDVINAEKRDRKRVSKAVSHEDIIKHPNIFEYFFPTGLPELGHSDPQVDFNRAGNSPTRISPNLNLCFIFVK